MRGCLSCAMHKDATSKTVCILLKMFFFCIFITTLLTAKLFLFITIICPQVEIVLRKGCCLSFTQRNHMD